MDRIEIDVLTGEKIVVPLTETELDEIQSRPVETPALQLAPVEKLRNFLVANPDVAALL